MKVPTRRPTTRRQVTRVLLTLAQGSRRRTTLVLVGRELAFDSSEEWVG
jgi:hypothetical protein